MTTILAASALAIVVLLTGSLPWALFGGWNQRAGLAVPWAIVPMAIYLWVYFRIIGGALITDGGQRRRADLRAHGLPARVWRAALPAGLLGIAAILALLVAVARLVHLPAGAPITRPPGMPAPTMFALLAMQSVVAGVTEESAFRGYMQSIVGRRYGVATGILASGVLFGLLHFPNHPRDVLVMLPYYVVVSAMYGGLTWAAGSIMPALVLHSIGDTVVLTRWWLTGLAEWQLSATTPPLVWDSGFDMPFAAAAAVAVLLCVATAWSYTLVHARTPCEEPAASSAA